MSTATVPPETTLVDVVNFLHPGQRCLLTEVAWEDYERLLAWRDEYRPSVRLTYDRGGLEVMPVSFRHERLRKVLDLLIAAWVEETGGEYFANGQLTHLRKDLERAFEPDECYYLRNWKKVAALREIDFRTDPPPDLSVEIEHTRPLLDKRGVFAAFKMPEVWRYDGNDVSVLLLQPSGEYQKSPVSLAIPNFPFADASPFLALVHDPATSFADIARRFRAWIRSLPPTAPTT